MENKNVIRLVFGKTGGLIYISHLDLQRAMARLMRRSKIPIRYSEGFNPHPRIVFAQTVSVGTASVCEMVDLYMKIPEDPERPAITPREFEERVVPNLPEGLLFFSCGYAGRAFSEITDSEYEITISLSDDRPVAQAVRELFTGELILTKRSKSGEKPVDILPMLRSLSVSQSGKELTLSAVLASGNPVYLNPEYLIRGLRTVPAIAERITAYTITRTKIIFSPQSPENIDI